MKNYVAGHVFIITVIMRRNISAPTITRTCNFLNRSLDSIFLVNFDLTNTIKCPALIS